MKIAARSTNNARPRRSTMRSSMFSKSISEAERPAEVDQRLPHVIAVAIEKLIQPDLKLVLDRRKQQRRNDRRDEPGDKAEWFETGAQHSPTKTTTVAYSTITDAVASV